MNNKHSNLSPKEKINKRIKLIKIFTIWDMVIVFSSLVVLLNYRTDASIYASVILIIRLLFQIKFFFCLNDIENEIIKIKSKHIIFAFLDSLWPIGGVLMIVCKKIQDNYLN